MGQTVEGRLQGALFFFCAVVDFPFPNPRTSPIVDAPWTINRISSAIGSTTFSGQAITFAGANPQLIAPFNVAAQTIYGNPIVLTGPMVITNFSRLTLSGGFSGTGPLTVAGGPGFSTLAGTSTFTRGLTVGAGQVVGFAGASMPGPVMVSASGLLAGSGLVAGAVFIEAFGVFNPGPGSSSAGAFGTGDFTVSPSATIMVTINGRAPGTQYSTVDVSGTVVLTGATLSLSRSYVPQPGDVFTIITNEAADSVTGTFAGLPEGATVTHNGVPLRVSYVGGTGNDVTLTSLAAVATPAAAVPTLSEWALGLLALMVLAIGLRHSRQVR
ncbi:MAG: IPTL-CTERM sorting domain-containing protein [Usitatibacter sp.]